MMRDLQNSGPTNEEPSPTRDDDVSPEKSEPSPKSYYYDDATGYEIYQEGNEPEDEEEIEAARQREK
jgi:hypothetical protein